jgi:hypothetical protein
LTILVILGLLLALSALAFVLYPIVRPAPASDFNQDDTELEERRAAIYRQILDVEFDQRLGKLSEADGRELSESLLSQAAALLAGEPASRHDIEAQLEWEILAIRRALAAGESEPAASSPSRRLA